MVRAICQAFSIVLLAILPAGIASRQRQWLRDPMSPESRIADAPFPRVPGRPDSGAPRFPPFAPWPGPEARFSRKGPVAPWPVGPMGPGLEGPLDPLIALDPLGPGPLETPCAPLEGPPLCQRPMALGPLWPSGPVPYGPGPRGPYGP